MERIRKKKCAMDEDGAALSTLRRDGARHRKIYSLHLHEPSSIHEQSSGLISGAVRAAFAGHANCIFAGTVRPIHTIAETIRVRERTCGCFLVPRAYTRCIFARCLTEPRTDGDVWQGIKILHNQGSWK